MGQKVNPIGFRVGRTIGWKSDGFQIMSILRNIA